MNLGELFFNLGFKTTGTEAAKAFENVISLTKKSMDQLSDSVSYVSTVVEAIALKTQSLTKEDAKLIKEKIKEKRATEDVNKAQKENNNNIGRAEKSTKWLTVAGNKLNEMLRASKWLVMGAAGSLFYYAKESMESALGFDKMSSMTGYTTTQIQQLENVANKSGVSINNLMSGISHLQEESTNIRLGLGGDVGVYQYLGLDPHEDPISLLTKLGKKLNEMEPKLGTAMGRKLGLSDDILYFAKKVDKENINIFGEKNTVDQGAIKRLKAFYEFTQGIYLRIKRSLMTLTLESRPAITSFLNLIEKLVSVVIVGMDRLSPMFNWMQNNMGKVAIGLGIVWAALNPWKALIVGLVTVLDDLRSFFKGEDSLFGDFLNYVTDINSGVKDMIHYFTQLLKFLGFIKAEDADKWESQMLKGYKSWLEEKKKEEKKGTQTDKEKYNLPFGAKKITEPPVGGPDIITPYLKLKGILNSFTPNSTMNMGSPLGPKGNKTNNINNININVNESKNPKSTANEIERVLSDTYWQIQRGEA